MKLVTFQFVMITCLLMVCVVGTWTRRQIPIVFDQPEVSTDASDDFIVSDDIGDTGDVGLGSDPSTLPPLDIEGEIEGELVLKPKYAIYGRVSKLENRLSKLEAEVERINSILAKGK